MPDLPRTRLFDPYGDLTYRHRPAARSAGPLAGL